MSDWNDDGWDEDYPDDDDETIVVPCPECGADVYEDAECCPICNAYIIHSSNPWQSKPTWWVMIGLAGIAATIFALSGF